MERKQSRKRQREAQRQGSSSVVETQILAALQCGFSLSDIKTMTVPEILTFSDLMAPDDDGPREATQDDIDKLLG